LPVAADGATLIVPARAVFHQGTAQHSGRGVNGGPHACGHGAALAMQEPTTNLIQFSTSEYRQFVFAAAAGKMARMK